MLAWYIFGYEQQQKLVLGSAVCKKHLGLAHGGKSSSLSLPCNQEAI